MELLAASMEGGGTQGRNFFYELVQCHQGESDDSNFNSLLLNFYELMDRLKYLGMDYLPGIDMPIHSFFQCLHSNCYMFPSCYLWQVCTTSLEVCGYFYEKFIQLLKSNLDKSMLSPALSTLETQDNMSMTRFALLADLSLSLQASTLSTPTGYIFISIASNEQQLGTSVGGSYVWAYVIDHSIIGWPSFCMVTRRPLLRIFFTKMRPLSSWSG